MYIEVHANRLQVSLLCVYACIRTMPYMSNCVSFSPGIIQDPESWNTTLGAYVSFYCLIMGDEANWEINGIKDVNVPALAGLSPYVIVTRASIPGALYTELRLTANSTNEVKIRCVSTYHSGSTAFSQTATMQVQGACSVSWWYICCCILKHVFEHVTTCLFI